MNQSFAYTANVSLDKAINIVEHCSSLFEGIFFKNDNWKVSLKDGSEVIYRERLESRLPFNESRLSIDGDLISYRDNPKKFLQKFFLDDCFVENFIEERRLTRKKLKDSYENWEVLKKGPGSKETFEAMLNTAGAKSTTFYKKGIKFTIPHLLQEGDGNSKYIYISRKSDLNSSFEIEITAHSKNLDPSIDEQFYKAVKEEFLSIGVEQFSLNSKRYMK